MTKPRYRFCWACSRQLYGNKYRTRIVDNREVVLHGACAKILDADLADQRATARPHSD